jgi:photosystem II stability/assembly factor-like uncharacterized protein
MNVFLFYLTFFTQERVYHGCAISPSGYIWICEKESSQVYASWDTGRTWINQGRPNMTERWLYDIFFLNDTLGWVAAEGGFVFHTTDGGFSWFTQNQGGTKFAQRVFMLNERFGWIASGEAIVLRTTDGGESWEQFILPNPPFPSDTVDFYGVSFIDSLTGWVVAGRYPVGDTFIKGQGYIAKTTDGGENWTLLRRDTIYDFFDCHFINANEGWVVGGNDRTFEPCILHTTDGGLSWEEQRVPSGYYLRACHFLGEEGWASGMFGTILHTTDGGETWTLQRTDVPGTIFDIEFLNSEIGVASGTDFALYTTDGGRNWFAARLGIKDYGTEQENKRYGETKGRKIYDACGRRIERWQVKGIYFQEEGGKIKKILICQ